MASLIQLPSIILDNVHEDALNATRAELTTELEAPFALSDGDTIEFDTDVASGVTVTFNAVDFESIDEATAAEVAAAINAALSSNGGGAVAVGDKVRVFSSTYGAGSALEVTGGTAAIALGFPSGEVTGSDATTQRVAINLYPEPDEVEVPRSATIQLDVFSSDGTAPAADDITVYVNGVVALTDGSFQAGFLGANSRTELVDSATRRVFIDPTEDFDSSQLVDVRVVSGDLDDEWSFTVVDLTAPQLEDALATGIQTVRVTFNEPVKASGVGPESALRPENWTLTALATYAVSARVVSVTQVDDAVFDLTTDIPLSFGQSYQVTAAATIADARGNTMAGAPNDRVSFAAFNPSVPAGRRFQLWDFIPDVNKEQDSTRDLRKFINILQEVVNLVLHDIDRFANILDPDLADEQYIDAMLADLGNPFEIDFSLADKRRLLGVLVEIYRLKGTKPGIESVIQFLMGKTVTVEPLRGTAWELGESELGYDNPLGPSERRHIYSFEIHCPVTLTAEERSRMRKIVTYMKFAREHLTRIVEPETEVEDFNVDHVELGYSELGTQWLLH